MITPLTVNGLYGAPVSELIAAANKLAEESNCDPRYLLAATVTCMIASDPSAFHQLVLGLDSIGYALVERKKPEAA
jgi:hypothetical protein